MSDNNFFTDDKFFFVGKRRKQTEKGKKSFERKLNFRFLLDSVEQCSKLYSCSGTFHKISKCCIFGPAFRCCTLKALTKYAFSVLVIIHLWSGRTAQNKFFNLIFWWVGLWLDGWVGGKAVSELLDRSQKYCAKNKIDIKTSNF